jgi:flagellar hook-length control protein FliK
MTADEVAAHEAQPRPDGAPASDRAKDSAPVKVAAEQPREGARNAAESTPHGTTRAADRPDRPHHHGDASKPSEAPTQALGAPVSEATHTAKPPSEAMPALLQASDRPLGPSLQPAGPATPAVQEAAVPIAGLAVEIAARAQAGRNRFEIRLDPPDLGRIDVRLDVDQSGQVTSRLVVERMETLEHLRRDAAELERALQQAGLKTADNGLQFTLRDQGFARRDDGGAAPETARLVVPDPELVPVDTLQGRYGRTWRASGIDIRV